MNSKSSEAGFSPSEGHGLNIYNINNILAQSMAEPKTLEDMGSLDPEFDHYLCDDCENELTFKSYSCTFTIHPYCHVNRRKWKDIKNEQQKKIMSSLLEKFLIDVPDIYIDFENYSFELTKQGYVHLHTTLITHNDDIDPEYILNNKFKYGTYKSFKCDLLVTEEDEERWNKYIHKEEA